MDDEIQRRADERFAARLEETGARDPREFYRSLLRELKESDASGYDDLVSRYRSEVLEPIAGGEGDPLVLWLGFGIQVVERLHRGRTVVVEEDGRSLDFRPPAVHGQLLLHLPENERLRAVPVGIPAEPTRAQRATLDLLVRGKTRPEADE